VDGAWGIGIFVRSASAPLELEAEILEARGICGGFSLYECSPGAGTDRLSNGEEGARLVT
jgi:hypothetical protein